MESNTAKLETISNKTDNATKRMIITAIVLGFILLVLGVAAVIFLKALNSNSTLKPTTEAPISIPKTKPGNTSEISDFFACGDYCPGDPGLYTVKVYTGITTREGCDKHGGEFTYFVGWGTTYYCKVK